MKRRSSSTCSQLWHLCNHLNFPSSIIYCSYLHRIHLWRLHVNIQLHLHTEISSLLLKTNLILQYTENSVYYIQHTKQSSRPAYLYAFLSQTILVQSTPTHSSSLVTRWVVYFSSSNRQKVFLLPQHLPCGTAFFWITGSFYIASCHALPCFLSQKAQNSSLSYFFSTLVCTLPIDYIWMDIPGINLGIIISSQGHFRYHSFLHHSPLLFCYLARYSVWE